MRYILLFLLFTCSARLAFSQQRLVEKNLEVGMYVKISKCKPKTKNFQAIDLYTKTRYPDSGIQIDTVTGEGVFERFFAPGDFDARRLPCSYGGKRYKIAAMRVFEVEGREKRVMICYTGNRLSMIWIELDKAVELKEIEL
jgi:hypothetical protein